jgi:acyl-CoA reductase-like NAD-dependent aldehyde dehydrogenase
MIRTISPVDGSVVLERHIHTPEEITSILKNATAAFKANKRTPLKERITIATRFLDLLLRQKDVLVCSWQSITDVRALS